MTIGIDAVDLLAARVAPGTIATITSTLRRTRSAARSSKRSVFPSALRHSTARFTPSTYPSSRRLCCKSVEENGPVEGPGDRTPIRHTFPACCASATNGAARSIAPVPATNARRSINGFPRDGATRSGPMEPSSQAGRESSRGSRTAESKRDARSEEPRHIATFCEPGVREGERRVHGGAFLTSRWKPRRVRSTATCSSLMTRHLARRTRNDTRLVGAELSYRSEEREDHGRLGSRYRSRSWAGSMRSFKSIFTRRRLFR